MLEIYGKKMDFRDLGRDLGFINSAASHNSLISRRALENGIQEIEACPICKDANKTQIKEINGLLWNKCDYCGHFFVSNVPLDVSSIYDTGNEAQKQAYIDEELFNKRKKLIAKPKAEFIDSVITESASADKGLWIDIGCGVGELLYEASALGYDTVGFEADPSEVTFAKNHGLNVIQTYIGSNQDSSASEYLSNAKIVTAFNILEHIADPLSWMKNIVSQMCKGGHLVIETPREPSLTGFCNLIGLPYKHMVTAGHLHIFTEKSMEIIQSECSLETIAKWCFGNGFVDLINTALILSDIEINNSILNDIFEKGDGIQKSIDEAGLSEVLFTIYKVR